MLRNNLAFSLARKNEHREAANILAPVDPGSLRQDQWIVYTATKGLIDYRAGRTEDGRIRYSRAIALGHGPHRELGIIAQNNRALEELRIGSEGAETLRKEALAAGASLPEPHQQRLVGRLKDYRPSQGHL